MTLVLHQGQKRRNHENTVVCEFYHFYFSPFLIITPFFLIYEFIINYCLNFVNSNFKMTQSFYMVYKFHFKSKQKKSSHFSYLLIIFLLISTLLTYCYKFLKHLLLHKTRQFSYTIQLYFCF